MQNREQCSAVVRQLWPYLDNVLPAARRARVLAHLDHCSDCRSRFIHAREFLDAIHVAGIMRGADLEPLRARVVSALVSEGFMTH